jgi:Ca2+-binding RTX toxin-like protein
VLGGDGIDYIEPGPGNDLADGGGSPLDILSYLTSAGAVSVSFSTGTAVGEGRDRFQRFNTVVGSEGDDTLVGSAAEQFFVPAGGDDAVDGGPGPDAILYVLASLGVTVDLSSSLSIGEGTDSVSGVEVVYGSSFDDVITGDAGYNWLSGGGGDDRVDGVGGEDTVSGDIGDDVCLNGLTYLGCENQGGDVFPVPPDAPEPSTPPDL